MVERGRIHVKWVDDWLAIYLDGDKVFEGHSCTLNEGLRSLGIPFTTEEDRESLEATGVYPERLPNAFPHPSPVVSIHVH